MKINVYMCVSFVLKLTNSFVKNTAIAEFINSISLFSQ